MKTKQGIYRAEIPSGIRNELIENLRGKENMVIKESIGAASGILLPDYVDVKGAYGSPRLLRSMAGAMWAAMDSRVTCVAAAGHGGIPLATALSVEHDLPLILVRDELKNHGRPTWLDGYVPTGRDFVAVVDDVLTTGGSIDRIVKKVTETTAPRTPAVLEAVVVVKRGSTCSGVVPVKYLLTRENLL